MQCDRTDIHYRFAPNPSIEALISTGLLCPHIYRFDNRTRINYSPGIANICRSCGETRIPQLVILDTSYPIIRYDASEFPDEALRFLSID